VCRQELRVYELPVAYYGRTYAEGKKITWKDGFKAMWVLLRVRFEPSGR
jgi:lysyl-tRNA synthetase class I